MVVQACVQLPLPGGNSVSYNTTVSPRAMSKDLEHKVPYNSLSLGKLRRVPLERRQPRESSQRVSGVGHEEGGEEQRYHP